LPVARIPAKAQAQLMEPLEQFGMNLKVLRVKRKLSQEALAAEAGIDRSYVGDLERGERNPSLLLLLRLCRALSCTLLELAEDVEPGDRDEVMERV
jgi:transcriptional regulator with XRE-family HTH domain